MTLKEFEKTVWSYANGGSRSVSGLYALVAKAKKEPDKLYDLIYGEDGGNEFTNAAVMVLCQLAIECYEHRLDCEAYPQSIGIGGGELSLVIGHGREWPAASFVQAQRDLELATGKRPTVAETLEYLERQLASALSGSGD